MALLGLGFTVYVSYGLFYSFGYLPSQGKLVNVMPDTSWIADGIKVFFMKDRTLYSISIQGSNPKKISDNVDSYKLSPDGTKLALWYRVKEGETYDKTLMGIRILDLKTGSVEIVEKERNCGYPQWLPNGLELVYEHDDDYFFSIFNIKDGTRKSVHVPKRVSKLVISKDGQHLVYLALFEMKYYQYDIVSGDITEMQKIKIDPKTATIYEYIDENDIYWGSTSRGPSSLDGKTEAYNKGGSLWLKSDGKDQLLVEYEGKFDSKVAPGVHPRALSRDGRFVAFGFKGKIYICEITSKRAGYLADGDNVEFSDAK